MSSTSSNKTYKHDEMPMEYVFQSILTIVVGLVVMLVIVSIFYCVLPTDRVESYKQIVVTLVGKVPSVTVLTGATKDEHKTK